MNRNMNISNKEFDSLLEKIISSLVVDGVKEQTQKIIEKGEVLVGLNGMPCERRFLVKKVVKQGEIIAILELEFIVYVDPDHFGGFLIRKQGIEKNES